MGVELDHVFVCVGYGAPEAVRLVEWGLAEGAPNVHAGQGTANRRFFFENSLLELLYVADEAEARSPRTAPSRLFERWAGRNGGGSCPFGIVPRPAGPAFADPPFAGWEYRPDWLSGDVRIHVGEAGLEEPMWVFMPFLNREPHRRRFVAHPMGARAITGLVLTAPAPLRSDAARVAVENSVLTVREGPAYGLSIELDRGAHGKSEDFRPELPLVISW